MFTGLVQAMGRIESVETVHVDLDVEEVRTRASKACRTFDIELDARGPEVVVGSVP